MSFGRLGAQVPGAQLTPVPGAITVGGNKNLGTFDTKTTYWFAGKKNHGKTSWGNKGRGNRTR